MKIIRQQDLKGKAQHKQCVRNSSYHMQIYAPKLTEDSCEKKKLYIQKCQPHYRSFLLNSPHIRKIKYYGSKLVTDIN